MTRFDWISRANIVVDMKSRNLSAKQIKRRFNSDQIDMLYKMAIAKLKVHHARKNKIQV